MHWPFVRATIVLVLLVCGVFEHGWHAPDATSASAATHVAHRAASGVDSSLANHHGAVSTVADQVSPSGTDAAVWDGHQPENHACGTAWAADKAHSLGTPALCKLTHPADNGGRGELAVAAPAFWSGRSLLLLQCISRT
jgi:hypothetical protein